MTGNGRPAASEPDRTAADDGTGPVPETGQDAVELSELAALDPVPAARTLRYGPGPEQLIDCFGAGPPAVVALHGGFWRQRYDRGYLTPFAAELAARGLPVALVEYRRGGAAADATGGWTQAAHDVGAALDALDRDSRRGGQPYGTGPVLLGHSAGGQLALWAAVRRPERVSGVVGFAPVADLDLAGRQHLGGGAVSEFFGPEWRQLLGEIDPMRLPSPGQPVTLLHGTADGQVPVELSLKYAERHPARLMRLPGAGHYGALVPGTPQFTTLALVLRHHLTVLDQEG